MFNSLVSTFHRFCPLLFVDMFGIVVLNNVETSEIMFPSHVVGACLQSTVDKLLKTANVSLAVGTSSWREQFIEAVTVSAGNQPT